MIDICRKISHRIRHKFPSRRHREITWPPNNEIVTEYGTHPSMEDYGPFECSKPDGCILEWDGSLFVPECLPQGHHPNQLAAQEGMEIGRSKEFGEELFEWVDLLESIRDCDESFVFIELGAGYGRWSIRAFNAATRKGIPAERMRLVTVEADPLHSRWLEMNFLLNKIPKVSHLHHNSAVSDWEGWGEFYVLQPGNHDREKQAREWYGQALQRSDNS